MYTPMHVSEKMASEFELEEIAGSRCIVCRGPYELTKRVYFHYFDEGIGWWHANASEHLKGGLNRQDRYLVGKQRLSLLAWAKRIGMSYSNLHRRLSNGEKLSDIVSRETHMKGRADCYTQ